MSNLSDKRTLEKIDAIKDAVRDRIESMLGHDGKTMFPGIESWDFHVTIHGQTHIADASDTSHYFGTSEERPIYQSVRIHVDVNGVPYYVGYDGYMEFIIPDYFKINFIAGTIWNEFYHIGDDIKKGDGGTIDPCVQGVTHGDVVTPYTIYDIRKQHGLGTARL